MRNQTASLTNAQDLTAALLDELQVARSTEPRSLQNWFEFLLSCKEDMRLNTVGAGLRWGTQTGRVTGWHKASEWSQWNDRFWNVTDAQMCEFVAQAAVALNNPEEQSTNNAVKAFNAAFRSH